MKINVKLDDYGLRDLKNIVRRNDPDTIMRAKDRQVSANNIRTNAMLDMTFTSSGGKKSWNQIVRFYPIYNGEIKGEISKEDFKDILYSADVGVYCDCPHFEYSGAAYNATQENYNIVDESRRPEKDRNRNSIMCKHAYNAVSVVSRNMSKITDRYYNILIKHNRITEPVVPVDEPEMEVIETPEQPQVLEQTNPMI